MLLCKKQQRRIFESQEVFEGRYFFDFETGPTVSAECLFRKGGQVWFLSMWKWTNCAKYNQDCMDDLLLSNHISACVFRSKRATDEANVH